jgi:hypothetical protein
MAEFIFNLDPLKAVHQPGVLEATHHVRQALTNTSINHTSYQPLHSRPIHINIQTKKAADDGEKEELRMAIW